MTQKIRRTPDKAGLKEEVILRTLVEHLPVGVYRATPAGRIIEANPALAEMLGYKKVSSLKKIDINDLYVDKRVRAEFMNRLKDAAGGFFEFQLKRRDGRVIWVRDYPRAIFGIGGKMIYHDGVLVDVTERKMVEDRLKEVEHFLSSIFDSIQDGICILDKDFRILTVNKTMERWYAHALPLAGKKCFEAFHQKAERCEICPTQKTLKTGRPAQEIVPRVGEKREITGWLELFSFPLIDRMSGEMKGVVEYVRDITKRKRAEVEQRTKTEQVIRHQEALLELTKLEFSDVDAALKRITEDDARTLDVERVGIWLYNKDRTEIGCRDLYVKSRDRHERGMTLLAAQHPRYFQALDEARVLAADDAHADSRTNEFSAGYLKPLGITSMLDIPIRLQGKLAAVICHEHTGPKRKWTQEEQQFAMSVGDIVSQALESYENLRMQRLKDSVFRISEAAISSENLHHLFSSIHRIIGEIMPAKNFYIAMYDQENDIVSFPYFFDEFDEKPAAKKLGLGLTDYVLKTGEPLLASPEVFEDLVKAGKVESIGAPSIDWLGVPLKIAGRTIGALVVQSYTEGIRYGEEDGNILRFVSDQAAMAIRRKQTEETIRASLREKEVLLREVNHRVKNNMQVISSLLNLQANRIQDPAVLAMFKESQRRIRSMALVHERLYQSADFSRVEFSEYLRSLAIHLFHSYQVNSSLIRLNVDVEKVHLNINTAIPVGLIVNELISNALKHAFPEGREGELSVSLRRTAPDKFVLGVKDNGAGFPAGVDFRTTDSLGMQIIITLVNQVEGDIILREGPGTDFEVTFKEIQYKQIV